MDQMDIKPVSGGVRVRRVIAYIVLVILSFLCLFWFYILFINATAIFRRTGRT